METFGIAVNKLVASLVAHLHVFHPVVVFRIVDADGRTYDQSCVAFHKLCVQVGTVCVERTDTVGSVYEVFLFRLSDNIDGTA